MAVESWKIHKLDELINNYVDCGQTVKDTKISRLTAQGENFGSTMLKVDLILEDSEKETMEVKVVAKLIPTLEFFKKLFDVQVTFKIEKAFYDTILPTLKEFQEENGIGYVMKSFPQFYGARLNLDGSDKVDADAVILLENLAAKGYTNMERTKGCDIQATKIILKDLARFHAVPIALKKKNPELFEEKIKKNMACFYPPPPKVDKSVPNAILESIIAENESCICLIPKLRKSMEYDRVFNKDYREPYATIIHQDLWVNNFMVKLVNKQVVKSKFVDFQGITYDSPLRDVLFFLFTSVEMDALEGQLDKFLEYYHQHFLKTLKDLNCSIDEFSEVEYFEELPLCGLMEIYHILFMYLFIITAKKGGSSPPIDEHGVPDTPPLPAQHEINRNVKNRAWWTLQEFSRRGWLGNDS